MAVARSRRTSGKSITPERGISGSYDDIEHREVYDGEEPKPGLYSGELVVVEQHTTSEDAVHWVFRITSGLYKGWRGHVYTNGTSMKWKQEQCLVGTGVMERGGTVSLTYEEIVKKAKPVRLRVINEPYEGEERGKIKSILPASTEPEPTEEDEEEDEDFDAPAAAPTRSRARRSKKSEPEPEEDEGEDEDEEEEGEEEEDEGGVDLDALEEELGDLDLKELKAKGKEFGLTLKDMRGKDEEELVDLILEKAEEAADKLPF